MADVEAAGGGAEETGPAISPRNRVKFLCSYGGKILPRPIDSHLKYVGGDTRFIAIPRDITFLELMKKISAEFEGDMVLKYQVVPDELDVLVSVRNDDDLKHMFDEYDRHESEGTPKLRAFLFPSNPVVIEKTTLMDPHAAEQRYVDAVNGVVRTAPVVRLSSINANCSSFGLSASSSPKCTSPESLAVDSVAHEPTIMNNYHVSRSPMSRVHSSPSLCNLNTPRHQSNNLSNQHVYQHHHQHHPHGHQPSSRPPHDLHRLSLSLSIGRPDLGRAPTGIGLNQYYHSRNNFGSVNSNKYEYHDEHSFYGFRTGHRSGSLPQSPRDRTVE